jgi:NADPH:quinone reductase-like Zn-dependent oxidoreductase
MNPSAGYRWLNLALSLIAYFAAFPAHAVASDRRVRCAAPHQSIVRAASAAISGNELFRVVASGKVRINVNQRFALKDAADAHKALEARATSGATILTI